MSSLSSITLMVTSTDGLAAWRAVVGEFRRTLDDPFRGWPVIVAIAIGLGMIWLNIRIARLIQEGFGTGGRHPGGPDPVDHAS